MISLDKRFRADGFCPPIQQDSNLIISSPLHGIVRVQLSTKRERVPRASPPRTRTRTHELGKLSIQITTSLLLMVEVCVVRGSVIVVRAFIVRCTGKP